MLPLQWGMGLILGWELRSYKTRSAAKNKKKKRFKKQNKQTTTKKPPDSLEEHQGVFPVSFSTSIHVLPGFALTHLLLLNIFCYFKPLNLFSCCSFCQKKGFSLLSYQKVPACPQKNSRHMTTCDTDSMVPISQEGGSSHRNSWELRSGAVYFVLSLRPIPRRDQTSPLPLLKSLGP